ncbi:hypothetical protein M9Y10_025262 [Tritrichomonas musculus]|uniref:Uncharacterized protein n=1 Tax=Tritrichomonas musculus TaxID=1915356 RepID=A0ABR2HCD5_9EUKA
MDIKLYFDQKKELYRLIYDFFECEDDLNNVFDNLINYIRKEQISNTSEDFFILLKMISYKINSYKPNSKILSKFENLIILFKKEIKQTFSNLEIFNIFKNNKLVLLYLKKNDIIKIDESVFNFIEKNMKKYSSYQYYFYEDIVPMLPDPDKSEILTKVKLYDPSIFNEKRFLGENDNDICKLIKNDSVEEFVSYVNKANINLSNTLIKESIFESNPFLMKKKEITLIEYATFYGAIRIFQYLVYNNVEIPTSLWFYAIYSNSADMIHLIETYIKPDNNEFKYLLKFAIKYQRNEIADYIINNLTDEACYYDNTYGICYLNFEFLSDIEKVIKDKKVLDCACKYNYITIARYILTNLSPKRTYVKIDYDLSDSFRIAAKKNNVGIMNLFDPFLNVIKYDVYKNCDLITEVKMLPSIKWLIKEESFMNCSSLTSIEIPPTVTTISKGAFKGCSSLTSIKLPSMIKAISKNTFEGCTSLKNIELPYFVLTIGSRAFEDCTSLEKIDFPFNLKEINPRAFSGCTSLVNVVLPPSIKLIGRCAFENCKSIESFKIMPSEREKYSKEYPLFYFNISKYKLIAYSQNENSWEKFEYSIFNIGFFVEQNNFSSKFKEISIPINKVNIF